MKNKQIKQVKSEYGINEYNVKRKTKKFSTINLLLLQVGICLAVSAVMLALRLIGGSEVVSTATAEPFLNLVAV